LLQRTDVKSYPRLRQKCRESRILHHFLSEGQGSRVVGLESGRITSIELKESCETEKPLDLSLIKLIKLLAR